MRRSINVLAVSLLLSGLTAAISIAQPPANEEPSATDTSGVQWSSAIQIGAAGSERAVSTICQFMSGPKAHGWHDYAPSPPAPLGSSCRDGVGSAGIVVTSGHGQQY